MKRLSLISTVLLVFTFALSGCGSSSNPDPGALGDACTDGAACSSGYCNGDVCSECEADGDCAADEACEWDDVLDYATCQGPGLGDLGDACTTGSECTSGFCNASVCSECEADGDCPGANTCVDDTAGVGYFVCQGGSGALGDACADGTECASGFCNGSLCSECEADGDCPGAATCVDDTAGAGYFVCQGGTGALGDVCAAGSECVSGYCNALVCSECETDGDCAGSFVCLDDTAGVGYFVCGSDLGALGDACTAGADCQSGFCNTDLCSECEADGDCGAGATCADDTAGVGYFVCQGGPGALGDVCAAGADCASGFCNTTVCSECEADGDCGASETCEDDTAGVGYFVCQAGTTGTLGDACVDPAECDSGFCFDSPGPGMVCSECENNGDCDVQQDCDFDPGAGYATCVGTGDLGDACDAGNQCISGFCNNNLCSECEADGDCAGGGACTDDTGGAGYWICTGGLGDDCNDPADCVSGFCYNGPGPGNEVCSECEVNGDCDVQQECDWDDTLDYATCQGTGDLGDACDDGGQCISGFCNNNLCSECEGDGDCSQGGACIDDTGNSGYYLCVEPLGEPCQDAANCLSGFCYNGPGPGNEVCSECEGDGDCAAQQECAWDDTLDWAVCVGTGDLGAACTDGSTCSSGFCNTDVCSECASDSDCGQGGTCLDDMAGVGYFVCLGGLGEGCQDPADCASGFCFGTFLGDICSECAEDGDCTGGQTCVMDLGDPWATCKGALGLGDACTDPSQCNSGICNTDVCSECMDASDCGTGGLCVDNTATDGYFACEGGLGNFCDTGADCGSGYCYQGMGGINFCSECEDDGDCPGGSCNFDFGLFYAVCG